LQHRKQRTLTVTPESLREQTFKEMKGDIMIGHQSTSKTKEILASYWWPGMNSQIDQHVQTCDKCHKKHRDNPEATTLLTSLTQCIIA
jgi:hypothetical protein